MMKIDESSYVNDDIRRMLEIRTLTTLTASLISAPGYCEFVEENEEPWESADLGGGRWRCDIP